MLRPYDEWIGNHNKPSLLIYKIKHSSVIGLGPSKYTVNSEQDEANVSNSVNFGEYVTTFAE